MIRCCAVILLMRVSMSTNKMMIPAFLLVFTLVANVQCRAEKSSENGEYNLVKNAFILSSLFTDAVVIIITPIYC